MGGLRGLWLGLGGGASLKDFVVGGSVGMDGMGWGKWKGVWIHGASRHKFFFLVNEGF